MHVHLTRRRRLYDRVLSGVSGGGNLQNRKEGVSEVSDQAAEGRLKRPFLVRQAGRGVPSALAEGRGSFEHEHPGQRASPRQRRRQH